jgi:multidrug efflux pump subunit AcrB
MMKGGRTLQDARLAKFYAENAPTIDHIMSWITIGGYASTIGKRMLDNIPMANLSEAGQAVIGALKGIKDIADKKPDDLIREISLITGYAVKDIQEAFSEINKVTQESKAGVKEFMTGVKDVDAKMKRNTEKAKEKYNKSLEEFNQAQKLYDKYYAEYELDPKKKGNKSKVSFQDNKLRQNLKDLKKDKSALLEALKTEQKVNGIDHEAEINELENANHEANIKKL